MRCCGPSVEPGARRRAGPREGDNLLDPAHLAKIRELAEHSPDGLTRLDAIVEGTRYWTEVLTRAVTLAREQGASWKDIGDALGVSPQAAHQRFNVRVTAYM